MLWKLFQFVVIVAVAGSNGQYHWTPNGYVAGAVAVFAAFALTALISELFRLLSWLLKQFRSPGLHQRHIEGAPAGRLGAKRFR
jgi:hypothetical protein